MSTVLVPQKVTVVVYSAKGLKPKSKGKHKFSVIFGIGGNKFRTDVVEDLFDNPVFNTESEIEVGDPSLPLILTVTEKQEKDVLGQVTIALSDISHSRTNHPIKVPLRPHKKCPNPEGELVMEAWISASTLGPPPPMISVTGTEGETKNAVTAGFKKLKDKMSHSPLLSRKTVDSKEQKRSQSTSFFNQTPKGSVSCQDLTSLSSNRTSLQENKHLKLAPTDSLSSLESISENSSASAAAVGSKKPEVNGISPNEGPVEGGTKITIRGTNLGLNKQDVIGLFICGANVLGSLEYGSSSRLTCITKPWKPCIGNVTVETQSGGKGSSLVQFTFISRDQASDSASEISSLSRSSSRGDADLRRTESNKSRSSEKAKGSVISTEESSALAKNLKAKSMFDLSLVPMTAKNPKPEVTGISPMEAPADGVTKLTIRGLNLGQSRADIVRLIVCGVDCLASVEYESSSKISCSVGPGKPETGNIVVETKSGGKGVSLVTFRFVESKEEETSSWAAVPYSASDEPDAESVSGSKGIDHLTVNDQRGSSPLGSRFDRTPQANGHTPAKLPPPVVEIQPMRMDKKSTSSPFRAFGKGKKSDKDKGSSDAQENRNYDSSGHCGSNEQLSNETINRRISELEQELSYSDEQVKKLQSENKLLKVENERMRRYMENLVNRAILTCPQILCVDD